MYNSWITQFIIIIYIFHIQDTLIKSAFDKLDLQKCQPDKEVLIEKSILNFRMKKDKN